MKINNFGTQKPLKNFLILGKITRDVSLQCVRKKTTPYNSLLSH